MPTSFLRYSCLWASDFFIKLNAPGHVETQWRKFIINRIADLVKRDLKVY